MSIIKMNTDISFPKTEELLNKTLDKINVKKIEEIAEKTIQELALKSPNKKMADAWSYEIQKSNKSISVLFNNSYVINGQNIVVLYTQGHASRSGKWIAGNDFIKGPIEKAIQEMSEII